MSYNLCYNENFSEEVFTITSPKLASENVYNSLKDKILQGEYLPGVHLVESELLKLYPVSRTTMREALRKLVDDEIAEQLPNKGIRVRRISLKELQEYYSIMEYLERLVVRLVAEKHGNGILHSLRDLLNLDKEAILSGNFELHKEYVLKFRMCLAQYTDNEPLIKYIKRIHLVTGIYYASNPLNINMETSHAAHEKIFNAIVSGDVVLAESTMADLIRHAIDIISTSDL